MARAARGAEQGGHKTQRLVSTRVASLPPGTYTDPGQTGLQLRVRAKRGGFSRTWLLRFKFKGEETRILLGHFPEQSLNEARGDARHYRELASQGIDPRRARPRRIDRPAPLPLSSAVATGSSRHSIEFLASEFIERHVRPHRKQPEYAQEILNKNVLPTWKGRDARTIKPREVVELLDGIVERGAAVMANRTAALLGQMFKFGIHRSIVEDSPVKLLYRPGGTERPRERVLTDDELKAFLKDPRACTRFDRLEHVILVLLLTGQRRGELTQSRWSDIDFEARTWTIRDEISKNGRGHVVPLTDWAVEELQALQREAEGSEWILPAVNSEQHVDAKLLTRGLAKCQTRFKAHGIEAFTLHDLRRTCRTGLARLKVEPHIAERVLNHVQERIPGTYDKYGYFDEKRAALEKWAAHLQNLCK